MEYAEPEGDEYAEPENGGAQRTARTFTLSWTKGVGGR